MDVVDRRDPRTDDEGGTGGGPSLMPPGPLDLRSLLVDLAAERPLFHNEADVKFGLAWLIQQRRPRATVRLEYKAAYPDRRAYLDLWVHDGDDRLAIELKYLTKALSVTIDGEEYDLVEQSALPIGRYHFLADVARVESIVAADASVRGAVLLLTNNPAYWGTVGERIGTIDTALRIHEGRTVHGSLAFGSKAGPWTTRRLSQPITLRGRYRLTWTNYRKVSSGPGGRFRYLLVEVDSPSAPLG